MGGKYINQSTAGLYMHYRTNKQLTQEAASSKVDISVRSGRVIENGHHYSFKKNVPRQYKTRMSPIDDVWEKELEPMLERNPDLQPKTLFIHLQRTHVDASGNAIYRDCVERTLQRKVAKWLALNGKPKEIMFPQEHIPGQQALSDFSHLKQVTVTIKGQPLKHMLYQFRLVYSKWSYVKIILSGESLQALSEGLQEALFALGGSPKEHRTDSLSAAFKNLSADAKKDLTDNYEALCAYYHMIPTRNNKGKKHENGSVESSHGHIKNRIAQEFILRGSYDFNSLADYEQWIQDIVKSSNQRNSIDFETERLALQSLPEFKTADYDVKSVRVSTFSMAIIKGMKYSVPSRLSGHSLTMHIYQQEIQAYLGSTLVFVFERKYLKQHKSQYVIDYRHMIHALIKKPGAFRYCQYRQELLPNDTYRTIWDYFDQHEARDVAPKMMLRLLKLAADYDCEAPLGFEIMQLIQQNQAINLQQIESQFNTNHPPLPQIECLQQDIHQYDSLISTIGQGAQHATL